MKVNRYVCDSCKEDLPEHYTPVDGQLELCIGKEIDPSGSGRTEPIIQKVDLCPLCLTEHFNKLIDMWDDDHKSLFERHKRHKSLFERHKSLFERIKKGR